MERAPSRQSHDRSKCPGRHADTVNDLSHLFVLPGNEACYLWVRNNVGMFIETRSKRTLNDVHFTLRREVVDIIGASRNRCQ